MKLKKIENHYYILSDDEIKEGDWYLYEQSFGIKFNTIAFVLNEFIQTLK